MTRAIFLDRDGTLIEDRDYLSSPDQVVLIPKSAGALRQAQAQGLKLIMVTNQSGVGRGFFTMEDVQKVHHRIADYLSDAGVKLDAIYIAPEGPDQPSRGRKPSPQFLFDARDEHGVRLEASYMVGDKWIDLECGWNAGVKRSILVRTGYGRQVEPTATFKDKTWVADDLAGAVALILNDLALKH